jgi:hypothetical protein
VTLEEEFQVPVRELLKGIVIPDVELPAWDIYPPVTNYDEWLAQGRYEADFIVSAASMCFDDITRGEHGSIHGQFPSPRKRKRTRSKK